MNTDKKKVLVVGACATRSYVEFFQKCYPDWEIRAALLVQAKEWIEEKNSAFLDYLESADIVFGLTDREPLKSLIPSTCLNIFIPSFDFFGYLPDSIFLIGIESPLGLGVIHSRIVSACYVMGKSEKHAARLFNKEHFHKLNYFDAYNEHKERLFKKYDAYNINLRNYFENWKANGNFMYTANHPHTNIFFDIACAAMMNYFPEQLKIEVTKPAKESINNYMADGLIWPVYPEISQHHGIPIEPTLWRTSTIHNEAVHMNLDKFIEESYLRYRKFGKFTEGIVSHMGGIEEIAKAAACDIPGVQKNSLAA